MCLYIYLTGYRALICSAVMQVLQPLGADISGSQFLEPDGTFPNHIPNPENKAAMAAAVEAVKRSGNYFGCVSRHGFVVAPAAT